jgi:hypothetical protein
MMSQRNPYEPPSAPIADPPARPGRRIGWKIYLWATTGLIVASVLWIIEAIRPLGFLDLGLTVPSYAGLWGYAYRRRVLTRGFWTLLLPVRICWDFAFQLVFEPSGLGYLPVEMPTTFILVLSFVMLTPLYLGLALYAMRSPEIWAAST